MKNDQLFYKLVTNNYELKINSIRYNIHDAFWRSYQRYEVTSW